MQIWQAIILGLVEGITEYLPISSTGHLIITSALLGLDRPPDLKAAVDAFSIVIQGGGILAVVGLYRVRVKQMVLGLLGRDARGLRLLVNIMVAFLPAAVIGLALDMLIDIDALLFRPVPVMAALSVGGLVMIFLGKWQRRFFRGEGDVEPEDVHSFVDLEHLTWRRALVIGVAQCAAIWPGTSRSMSTIVGGMVAGLRPRQAAEFSFLLGLPTLTSACGYRAAKNLLGDGPNMFEVLGVVPVIIGTVVAMISAALTIKWLVGYLTRHGVSAFGWYRIILCVALLILSWMGLVHIAA